VKARPTFERAYSVLGYTYYEMHNLQESLASYEKAISIAPKYMDVYNNMMATLAHMEMYARGVETGKTLLKHQPDDMSATIQTAVMHECAGELKEALRLLRRALSIQAEQGARGLHRMSNSYLNVAICAAFDDVVDDKIRLQKHLANLDQAFPGNGFDVLPEAFELPLERQAFEHEYARSSGGSGSLWIVKPAEAANGAGVRLLESLADLPSERERWLVQRYIERPLLLDGRKFDMRLFALVTNVWPLRIYLFPDGASGVAHWGALRAPLPAAVHPWPAGLGRHATAQYTASLASLSQRNMHLTNRAVNQQHGLKCTPEVKRRTTGRNCEARLPVAALHGCR
jgi:hypothetical protein